MKLLCLSAFAAALVLAACTASPTDSPELDPAGPSFDGGGSQGSGNFTADDGIGMGSGNTVAGDTLTGGTERGGGSLGSGN